jgi:hypothetical protein
MSRHEKRDVLKIMSGVLQGESIEKESAGLLRWAPASSLVRIERSGGHHHAREWH